MLGKCRGASGMAGRGGVPLAQVAPRAEDAGDGGDGVVRVDVALVVREAIHVALAQFAQPASMRGESVCLTIKRCTPRYSKVLGTVQFSSVQFSGAKPRPRREQLALHR